MNCLFYCICGQPGPLIDRALMGVGDRPVYRVTHRGLSAAISAIGPTELAPDLAKVQAYERVVNSYHGQGTIIPMRYGSVLEQESQVIKFLAEHDLQYQLLLEELEGCVEMGLRLLLPTAILKALSAGDPPACGEVAEIQTRPTSGAPNRQGLTYLTARKAHYAHQDRWTTEYRQAAERCLSQFHGLFVKSKTVAPTPALPLLSLYFLVRRTGVDSFRQTFRQLSEMESARLLLSGPWPPYNFVMADPII